MAGVSSRTVAEAAGRCGVRWTLFQTTRFECGVAPLVAENKHEFGALAGRPLAHSSRPSVKPIFHACGRASSSTPVPEMTTGIRPVCSQVLQQSGRGGDDDIGVPCHHLHDWNLEVLTAGDEFGP